MEMKNAFGGLRDGTEPRKKSVILKTGQSELPTLKYRRIK